MSIIYISIPMANHCMIKQRKISLHWQAILESQGHTVINPFLLGDHLDAVHVACRRNKPTYKQYLDHDLCEMQDAEAIFLCQGWSSSNGCLKESEKALLCEMQFIFDYKHKIG